MLVPWSVGASVFLRGHELWSPAEFWDKVRQHGLTAINLPPAYFRHCPEALDVASGAADLLRLVIVGGDVFPLDALPKWQALGVRVLNAYGPTEAVITATVHELPDQPAGRARTTQRQKPPSPRHRNDTLGRHVRRVDRHRLSPAG